MQRKTMFGLWGMIVIAATIFQLNGGKCLFACGLQYNIRGIHQTHQERKQRLPLQIRELSGRWESKNPLARISRS